MTLIGLAAGLLGARALVSGEVVSGATWIAAGQVADILDGHLARRLGAETEAGALLDWHADLAITAVLLASVGAWALVGGAVMLQTGARRASVSASGRTISAVYATAVAGGWL